MATPDDLRREKPEYYAQIQGNYLATGRRWCDFVSYDPRCANPLLAVKILRIPRDEMRSTSVASGRQCWQP